MPWEACADLIGSIYNQSTISSKSNLCLVCAIAAVGGKYYTDVISDSVCQGYFELTHSLFQDTIEHDPLAAMRVSICLSVYLVLDKIASTRIMLGKPIPSAVSFSITMRLSYFGIVHSHRF